MSTSPLRVRTGRAADGTARLLDYRELTSPIADADVRFGSKAGDLCVTESRPLHPIQRTNAEASFNVRIGPIPEVGSLVRREDAWPSADSVMRGRLQDRAISDHLPLGLSSREASHCSAS
jgi:hypothetical protein